MFKTHPFHPAIVHFPIAFLTATHAIDILHYLTAVLNLPILTTYLSPLLPPLLRSSRLLHTLGLATAVPAVLSGIVQASDQAAKPGNLYESDGKTIKRKFFVMATHAALNDLLIIASAVSWWGRFKTDGFFGETGAQGVPGGKDYVISGLVVPVLFYTASLGGDLVYRYGMGFSVAKANERKTK
ncbi:hypothetical protein H072_123 [Dactylellina haptotyla CBS 200.50]|uniref:DUF2231 domain-containing protein n=1 Tax=Dactylellina haptotyla (strain CBS 200.50) TaxID=1284197 RepID=S8CDL2_DACHA|nr:hypothetical protein H072_123 [Dactylellina haptotyla CBS 200.50]